VLFIFCKKTKTKTKTKLAGILQREKEIASKEYFETLISQSTQQEPMLSKSGTLMNPNTLNNMENKKFSPIEEIFHKHMKRSLLSYEQYYKVGWC